MVCNSKVREQITRFAKSNHPRWKGKLSVWWRNLSSSNKAKSNRWWNPVSALGFMQSCIHTHSMNAPYIHMQHTIHTHNIKFWMNIRNSCIRLKSFIVRVEAEVKTYNLKKSLPLCSYQVSGQSLHGSFSPSCSTCFMGIPVTLS